jgi:cyclophilin family peptidyl-prolyl cis-trans isomerase
MKKFFALLMLISMTMLTGCGDNDDVVIISTPYGDMVAILYDSTPLHKQNFLKLTRRGFYDSILFHRVIKGFMIQGGDSTSKHAQPGQPLGSADPAYTLPAEFVPQYFHERGALAAARLGDDMNPERRSSASQFYIVQGKKVSEAEYKLDPNKMGMELRNMYQSGQYQPLFDTLQNLMQSGNQAVYEAKIASLVPRIEKMTGKSVSRDVRPERLKAYTTVGGTPFLDDQYTVFGKIVSGMDVVDKIADVETGEMDRPLKDVPMKVTVKSMSKKEIEKKYGYKYPEVKKALKK